MTSQREARALTESETILLREILQKRAPQYLGIFQKVQANTLDRDERRELIEVLGDEFAETGIGPDSEPLARGLQLENLIDLINRPNLFSSE